jgi:hypothetical protein
LGLETAVCLFPLPLTRGPERTFICACFFLFWFRVLPSCYCYLFSLSLLWDYRDQLFLEGRVKASSSLQTGLGVWLIFLASFFTYVSGLHSAELKVHAFCPRGFVMVFVSEALIDG